MATKPTTETTKPATIQDEDKAGLVETAPHTFVTATAPNDVLAALAKRGRGANLRHGHRIGSISDVAREAAAQGLSDAEAAGALIAAAGNQWAGYSAELTAKRIHSFMATARREV